MELQWLAFLRAGYVPSGWTVATRDSGLRTPSHEASAPVLHQEDPYHTTTPFLGNEPSTLGFHCMACIYSSLCLSASCENLECHCSSNEIHNCKTFLFPTHAASRIHYQSILHRFQRAQAHPTRPLLLFSSTSGTVWILQWSWTSSP